MTPPSKTINLFYYIKLLWSRRTLITSFVGLTTALIIVLVLIMPKTYSSTAVLLPPSSEGSGGIAGMLSSLPFGGMMGGGSEENNAIKAILNSRTLLQNIVTQFNLVSYYGVENNTEARILLAENMNYSETEEGAIAIIFNASTEWFHPDDQEAKVIDLSHQLASYCVEELDKINKSLKTEKASFNRAFIEKRYFENMVELARAEDSLKAFQMEHGIIELEEQVTGSISTAISIQQTLLLKEVELSIAEKTYSPDHPNVIKLLQEVGELQKALENLNEETLFEQKTNLLIPFENVPELGLEWLRLKRKIEVQNQIFIFLTQQYEEAKISEAKDTPTVQLLDVPEPAELKTSPQRTKITIVWFLIAITVISLYVIVEDSSDLFNLGTD